MPEGLPGGRNRPALYVGAAALCVLALLVFIFLKRSATPSAERDQTVSTGTFSGTLDDVLRNYSLTETERYGVAKAYSRALNLKKLRESDLYAVRLTSSGAFISMDISKDQTDYVVARSSEGGFFLSSVPMELKTSTAVVAGEIRSSLWESLTAKGVPPDVILDFADIFSWSVDFLTEVRDGDKYRLLYEYKTAPDGRMLTKRILAVSYEGVEAGRKAAGLYNGNYYDENGDSVRNMFLRAPLHYRRISSYFTLHRFHPILKYVRPHLGIDYAAPTGTPVSSVAEGTVTFAARKGANGNLVQIRHPLGYATSYGHLNKIRKGLRSGAHVAQGDVIGYVGATGMATGPHLDFRINQNGRFINFLKIKYRSSGGLGGKAKEEFLKGLKDLLPDYFK